MSKFALVPAEILEDVALSSNAKLVYVCLCLHRGQDGRAWPSLTRLGRLSSLARSTTVKVLAELESRGYVSRRRRTGEAGPQSTVYEIPAWGGSSPDGLPSTRDGLPSTPDGRGVVRQTDGGSPPHGLEQYHLTNPIEQPRAPSGCSPSEDDPATTCTPEDQEPIPSSEGKAHNPLRALPEAIVGLWNETMAPQGHPRVLKLTAARRQKLLARIKESPGRQTLEGWRTIFEAVREHSFFGGHRPGRNGPFYAPLDWLVRSEDNIVRLLEDVAAQRQNAPDTIPWVPVVHEGVPQC